MMKKSALNARRWLRRVMPRVAAAAAALFVAWLVLRGGILSDNSPASTLFGLMTFLLVASTILYYGPRASLWLKRILLWRVRRRLVITYLFVGLTPILLLGLLGALAALIGSGQAMSRIVAVQLGATERQSLANAEFLLEEFARLPEGGADGGDRRRRRTVQAWLDERTAALQASLPGARVALWRGEIGPGNDGGLGMLGQGEAAQFASAPSDEKTRGVGGDTTPLDAPLPAWLTGRAAWSGFAYVPPPENSIDAFGSPSVRALVRRHVRGQNLAVLLVVPVSRALIERFHEVAGIRLHPFFLAANEVEIAAQGDRDLGGSSSSGAAAPPERQRVAIDFDHDQLGEEMPGQPFLTMLPVKNWLSGENVQRLSFTFSFSLTDVWRQLRGSSRVGERIKRVLIATTGAFLLLELLALLGAAWITRAVTGTVHKLYQATEFIKRGDFSHRVRVRSRDQLGELAVAFNEMSANIESLLRERVERERLEREIEIAAEVQAQLFPRGVPTLSTVEVAAECRAARGVAGDYYDYVEVMPGVVAFALGDVAGKGISAALVMSNLQAALRAQTTSMTGLLSAAAAARPAAITTTTTTIVGGGNQNLMIAPASAAASSAEIFADLSQYRVAGIASSINRQLYGSTDANLFATLFLALYDDRTRLLRYVNAGHNAPLLVRADNSVERLEIGGTIVGAFDWVAFEEGRVTLEPGELLIIFSDGISEAQNALGEEFGETRLAELAIKHRNASADEIRCLVSAEVDDWTGARERSDDQTLVIIKAAANSA